jgi:hypothetical protein
MGYWGRVRKRALVEARADISLDKPVKIVTGIALPIVGLLTTWLLTGNVTWGGIVGVVLLIVFGLILFISKLFSVPAEMDKERAAELEAMEAKLASRAAKEETVKQLMTFVSQAKAFQRKLPTAEHPTSDEIKRWVREVRNYIKEHIGYALAFKFGDDTGLDMTPNRRLGTSANPRAPKDFALLHRRIQRLSEIIGKFA